MILEKFSDAEAMFYALTQDESGLDLAEFLFVDSSDEGKKNHGIFRAWPFQVAWFRNKAQQHIDAAGRCIAEGQLVLTENGWVPIEEIEVGVRVLTHTGKWQKVTHVWDRGVKDVVTVKTQGHPDGITVTPDHKFFASHAKRASMPKDGHRGKKLLREEWIAPSDFRFTNGSQIINTHVSSPRCFDYLEPDFDMEPVNHGKKTNVIDDILSLDWLWLYGLFIAEGCTHRNEKWRTYRSEWSLHQDEIELVTPYFDRLGINYNVSHGTKDASAKIRVNSKPVTLWLHRNAGYLSHGKEIAPWVFSLTKEQRRAVLDGYIFGDGFKRKDEDGRYGFTTASFKLALSVRMLANSLDMSYSVWNKKAHSGWIRDEWVVGGPAFAGEVQELSRQNKGKARNVNTDKHVWLGVDSVEPAGEIRTWDLTVEGDHSFVVEGYVVHNSVGKAINTSEAILTADGWKTMGSIVKGDYVFSEKGEPVEVLRAFSELKDRDCYKVTFDDGCEIIVDGEHNWSTYKENDVRLADHSGGVPGISVSTTIEILNTLTVDITDPDIGLKRTEFNHRVPYIDAIQFHGTNLTNSDLHRCVYRLAGFRSRRIVGVEPVESVTVRCIEVDNPTHLFLVGEGLIPTHNSMSIKFRAMAFPFIYPGEEMLITAPESSHLETVTDNFERMILKMRLMRELIDGNIKHKPFHLNWKTTSRTMGRIPQKDGHGVQGCVESDTLILVKGRGYVEAREVLVGEEVWSAYNTWTKVLHNNEFSDTGFRVKGAGDLPIVVNDMHRFYGKEALDWNAKKKIELSDRLWLDYHDWTDKHSYWAMPRFTDENYIDSGWQKVAPNEDLAWLLGLYAADGYLSSNKAGMSETSWRTNLVAHPSNHEQILSRIDSARLNYSIKSREHSSADIIELCGKDLAQRALAVGRGSSAKRVPYEILFAPLNIRKAFFEGYMFGDGTFDERGRIGSSSVSKTLHYGIRHLGMSLGYFPSVNEHQPTTTEINGIALKSTPKIQFRMQLSDRTRSFYDDNYIYGQVKEVENVGTRTFSNLITEDHTYLSAGVASHNTHAMVLEHDEGAAYPESGWVELPETVQQNNPRTRWRCIADDQLVLTKNGLKKISSVEIGDLVWTHKNRWRPVVKVFDNGIADCVEVATTDGKKVISTPDHKFLMSDTGDSFNWLPVEENYKNSNSPVFCVVFHSDIIQGFTLSQVKSVLGVGERHVYDLEVEEDHSYVVNGMVVSNCHGVSFGFGGRFNEIISGADPNWTVTHLPAMIRPNWNEAEREKRIVEYGGYESSGYRRNILGLPSDMGSPIFPLNQLMAVIDTEEDSEYNSDIYYYASLDEGQVSDLRLANPEAPVSDLLSLPISHQNYSSIWIGMDIGWTISPSAICIFAEDATAKKGSSGLRLIGRILLNKFSGPDQARIVTYLMRFYRPVVFAMDATGAGKPLWDFIDEQISNDDELKILRGRVKNINFSEKVIVGFDENIKIQPGKGKDAYLDAAIKRPFVEASTDSVRKLVGDRKIALPYDRDLLSELQAAPQKGASVGSTLDEYGRSGRKKGMHNLDAIRCAVFSYDTKLIDQMIASHNTIWEPPGSVWF